MDMRELLDYLLANGKIWTAEHAKAAVTTGTSLDVGFVTGPLPMVALRRTYGSSGNLMTISLYEVAFTGGTNVLRTYNRNQSSSNPSPIQMKADVTFTPNTPIASVTARGQTSTGNATLTVPDESQLILKRATSYVLRMTNGDAGNADMGFQISFRDQQLTDIPV